MHYGRLQWPGFKPASHGFENTALPLSYPAISSLIMSWHNWKGVMTVEYPFTPDPISAAVWEYLTPILPNDCLILYSTKRLGPAPYTHGTSSNQLISTIWSFGTPTCHPLSFPPGSCAVFSSPTIDCYRWFGVAGHSLKAGGALNWRSQDPGLKSYSCWAPIVRMSSSQFTQFLATAAPNGFGFRGAVCWEEWQSVWVKK